MRFSHAHTLPTLYVPPSEHPVAASTDQQLSAWAPIQGQHAAGILGKGAQALPPVHIPQEHLPTASAPATTGEPAAIGTPHHARNHATMSLQPLEQRAVGHLPDGHQPIRACTGEPFAIRTPGHVVEADRMMRTHCSLATSHTRRVPSSLPLSRRWLSGVKAMLYTGAVCPRS